MYNFDITKNYGNCLNEQVAVLDEDLNPRLKQYLENDDFIEELAEYIKGTEDGDNEQIQINSGTLKEFGILEEDKIWLNVDKSDPKDPKFNLWILNDQYLWGDIDLDSAAIILYEASQEGNVGTNILNTIGSLAGIGDAGDAGTNELAIVSVAGAIAQIAADKDLDPKMYFDKLAEIFEEKYKKTITSMLEEEFSGRDEAVALNTFRRDIEDSTLRGLNIPTIVGDILLTAGTFGIGTAARASVKGASAANKTVRYVKSASAANKAVKSGKLTKLMAAIKSTWKGLSPVGRMSKMKKAFPLGSKITYIDKGGNKIVGVVSRYTAGTAGKTGTMMIKNQAGGPIITNVANLVYKAGKPGGISLRGVNKLGMGSLAAKKLTDIDNITGNVFELLGYYDTLTADPSEYIENVQIAESSELAAQILKLKEGSGIWGNTTDQEELAMALIITSLTPIGAKGLQKAYGEIAKSSTIYSVLGDEIGSDTDLGMFPLAYWTGCTGEGSEFAASIEDIRQKITKSSKK